MDPEDRDALYAPESSVIVIGPAKYSFADTTTLPILSEVVPDNDNCKKPHTFLNCRSELSDWAYIGNPTKAPEVYDSLVSGNVKSRVVVLKKSEG